MPEITFLQKDGTARTVDAPENWSLMQIALHHAIKGIDGICGGAMACATCHIYIDPQWQARVEAAENEKTEEENDTLDVAFEIRETSRLSCQIKMSKALDGLIVALPGTKTKWL